MHGTSRIQLFASADNGWSRYKLRRLRCQYLMPISCYFWDCNALLGAALWQLPDLHPYSLPEHVSFAASVVVFRSRPKTHLFSIFCLTLAPCSTAHIVCTISTQSRLVALESGHQSLMLRTFTYLLYILFCCGHVQRLPAVARVKGWLVGLSVRINAVGRWEVTRCRARCWNVRHVSTLDATSVDHFTQSASFLVSRPCDVLLAVSRITTR